MPPEQNASALKTWVKLITVSTRVSSLDRSGYWVILQIFQCDLGLFDLVRGHLYPSVAEMGQGV